VTAPGTAEVLLATAAGSWSLDRDAEALVAACARHGVRAEPAVWDDPGVDWSAPLVVVRSTWDYTGRLEEFLAWAERVERSTTLANPSRVLRWTTDKRYLGDLAGNGVPTVPCEVVEPGGDHRADLVAALERQIGPDVAGPDGAGPDGAGPGVAGPDGAEVVIKPTVSAGSKDTLRVGAADLEAGIALGVGLLDADRAVLVGPYLGSVDERGETGMVHFGGSFSHAFCKAAILRRGAGPVDGPFAEERITPREATPAEREVADAALRVAATLTDSGPLLYARVDLVHDDRGRPVVLELELCEPSFFVEVDPGSPDRFARAVRDRLDR